MTPIWPSLIGALALALPMPVADDVGAAAIAIRMCGAPGARIFIPMQGAPESPDPGIPCGKACHIGGCRRNSAGADERT